VAVTLPGVGSDVTTGLGHHPGEHRRNQWQEVEEAAARSTLNAIRAEIDRTFGA
jgi:hypothetical protein